MNRNGSRAARRSRKPKKLVPPALGQRGDVAARRRGCAGALAGSRIAQAPRFRRSAGGRAVAATTSRAGRARRAGGRPPRRSASPTPCRAASSASTGAVCAPSATVRRSAISAARVAPSPSALPSEKLRLAVEEQVSTRSPSPHRPASVSRSRPQRLAEAQHLGIAARDQRGAGVLAQAQPVDHAAGDREHVLDRAADLRAGHVVGIIGAEGGPGDRPGEPLPLRLAAAAGQRDRGRQPGGDFVREGRAGKHRDVAAPGAASRATSVISRPVPASIPLEHSTRSRGCARQSRRAPRRGAAPG